MTAREWFGSRRGGRQVKERVVRAKQREEVTTAAPTVAPSAEVGLVTYPPTSVVTVTALETPPVFDLTAVSISLSRETEIEVTAKPMAYPYPNMKTLSLIIISLRFNEL
jgi:hypothetical protein